MLAKTRGPAVLRPGARAATHISARREPIPSQGPRRAPATAHTRHPGPLVPVGGGTAADQGVLALLPQVRCPRPRGQQPRHRGGLSSPLSSGAGDHVDRTPGRASNSAPEQAPGAAADPLGAQKPGILQAAAWAHLSWQLGGTFLTASQLGESSRAAVCVCVCVCVWADSPVLGSYTSPSFTSTLLKRTTPASLGKGFRVSPAEKDTRDGAGTPGRREDAPAVRPRPSRGLRAVPRGSLGLAFRLKSSHPGPDSALVRVAGSCWECACVDCVGRCVRWEASRMRGPCA